MIDLNKAGSQKPYLSEDALYTVKDVSKYTGVALKRIYDLVDSGIITPCNIVQKGDGIRNFTYYDCINVFEVYLAGRLSMTGLPKRVIKEFFISTSSIRDSLDPFKIERFTGGAFLVFSHGEGMQIDFEFIEGVAGSAEPSLKHLKGKSLFTLVNLKNLAEELFKQVEKSD